MADGAPRAYTHWQIMPTQSISRGPYAGRPSSLPAHVVLRKTSAISATTAGSSIRSGTPDAGGVRFTSATTDTPVGYPRTAVAEGALSRVQIVNAIARLPRHDA